VGAPADRAAGVEASGVLAVKLVASLGARALGLAAGVPVLAWPLILATAAAGWGHWSAHTARTELAELQVAVERARADTEAETVRRMESLQEVTRYANQSRARDQAHAVALDAAAVQLRRRVAALLASRATAAGAGAPAADAAVVCADLLQRADARLRELAHLADERGTAGQSCERAYDALTPPG
jgi:hypothetical protein